MKLKQEHTNNLKYERTIKHIVQAFRSHLLLDTRCITHDETWSIVPVSLD